MDNIDISVLEQTIERYPWFSLAHLELFKKVSELGEEQKAAYLGRTAAYIHSREKLFEISMDVLKRKNEAKKENEQNPLEEKNLEEVIDEIAANEEMSFEIESDPLHLSELPKIVLAGGDYFCKTDFENVKLDTTQVLDKFIVEKPSLLRSNPVIQQKEVQPVEEIESGESFNDAGFYTETLAKIYSEQSFYKRALEVYAKLILLYPEKSSYFAALVQELKSKHNQ